MCYQNLRTNEDVCGKRFPQYLLNITPYVTNIFNGCTACGKCFFLRDDFGDFIEIVEQQQQQFIAFFVEMVSHKK